MAPSKWVSLGIRSKDSMYAQNGSLLTLERGMYVNVTIQYKVAFVDLQVMKFTSR